MNAATDSRTSKETGAQWSGALAWAALALALAASAAILGRTFVFLFLPTALGWALAVLLGIWIAGFLASAVLGMVAAATGEETQLKRAAIAVAFALGALAMIVLGGLLIAVLNAVA